MARLLETLPGTRRRRTAPLRSQWIELHGQDEKTTLFRRYPFMIWSSAVLVYCLAGLFTSLIAEVIFDLAPCKLCLVQRISLFLLLIAVLPTLSQSILGLVCTRILLAAICLISSYHLAIQMGWITDPCILPKASIESVSDLKQLLQRAPSCARIGFSIAGLPISGLNALCLFILFGCSFLLRRTHPS